MLEMQIVGNIGQDAMVSSTEHGVVARFSVAHSEKRGDSKITTWVDCSLWDREKVFPYLKKGAKVWLRGFPSIKTYEDKGGQKQSTLRINAHSIELLAKPMGAMQAIDVAYDNQDTTKVPAQQDVGEQYDELPF